MLWQVGNEKMTLGLEWTGQEEFVAQPLRDWKVGDHKAGVTRNAGPLTFATINGAGHMVRLLVHPFVTILLFYSSRHHMTRVRSR